MKRPYDREKPPGKPEAGLVRYKRKIKKNTSLAVTEIVPMDLPPIQRRADEHPVAVYLARLAPGSRPTMKQSLEVIARELGSTLLALRWQDIRYQHVQAIRARLVERYAPKTANKILGALRGVLHEAKRLGLMSAEDYMNAKDVETVKGTRIPKGRSLTDIEINKLFASLDPKTLSGSRDAALLAIMYGTGTRRNEVTNLLVSSYNHDDKTLHIRGKGNKERIVYLDAGVLTAVDRWLEERGSKNTKDPLFVPIDKWGHVYIRRMSDLAITFRLEDIAKKSGVKIFASHDMRRTFVTRLLERGVDIRTAQKLAGHEQVDTTAKYDRRGEETKKEAVKVLRVPLAGVKA